MILQLSGEKPIAKTINIENFDGFNGVSGEAVGDADASFADGTYTITGTAQGANPNHPNGPRTVPFRINAQF